MKTKMMLFCGVVVVSMVLFLMPPHISYRTIRQSEMRMYHPSKFTEMVVLSNRHPFPDSPSILEESHELKCVSVSNRTEGICLLYSGFGSGEPFHNVKKNDLLIFQFDKDDNLVGVVDKGGKPIGFAPSLLSDDKFLKSLEVQSPNHEIKLYGTVQKLNNEESKDFDAKLPLVDQSCLKSRAMMLAKGSFFVNDTDANFEKNSAANELFSLPELPDGVVSDLAQMAESADEDEVWRDYCLQFLGSALERTDGVTDADRALARETLVEALASTNATFAGTALRALHRGDPSDPLVASNALRIARDPSYPSSSRTTALLILEDCVRATPSTASTLTETASAISSDPSASSLLRRTAEAVQKRSSVQSHDQWNDQGGSQ